MTTSDKRPFTITYKHPGAQPPVYVAGSFTTPAWEPQELEAVPVSKEDDAPGVASGVLSDSSEYVFSKQFEIAVGDWQYKFRLGDGDWWVCDESADITTDNVGNQNNVLVIKPQSKLKAHEDKHYHVGPHTGPRDSGHAWNSTGSSRVHDEATGDHTDQTREHSHKKQCDLIGHHNSSCLAHGVSSDSTCICNPPPTSCDNIITKEKLPAIKLPHSAMRAKGNSRQAGLEKDTQLPLIPLEVAASTIDTKTPVTKIEEVTDKNAEPPAFEAHTPDTKDISKTGNRRMSAAIAERVKLLMSIPDIATAPISTVVEDPTADLKLNDPEATTDIDITPSTSHGLSPLFSHERLTPDDADEIRRTRGTSSMSRPEKGRQFSHDYAPLEVFPSGAGPILKRIATTRSQLDADETTDEIVSAEEPSPVTELMHSPTFSHERCPSEQSVLHSVGSPSESPLPPSISPAGSHERKRSDMDVISEQEDKDSSHEDELAEKDSHEGNIDGGVNQVHYSAGVDVSTDSRPIGEEHGLDEHNSPDDLDGTVSQSDEDERQPLLNSGETVQGHYAAFPRVVFESEGTRKQCAAFESSATTGSKTSEVTALPVPFYVIWWLCCLHYLSVAFAKIFRRERASS